MDIAFTQHKSVNIIVYLKGVQHMLSFVPMTKQSLLEKKSTEKTTNKLSRYFEKIRSVGIRKVHLDHKMMRRYDQINMLL